MTCSRAAAHVAAIVRRRAHPRSALPALLAACLAALAPGCSADENSASNGRVPPRPVRVLVVTGGGYHDFVGNPQLLLDGLRAETDLHFDGSARLGEGAPDAAGVLALLAAPDLATRYDALLLYTQGELGFTDAQQLNLAKAVANGLGIVALHCALDSHPNWPAGDMLLGARFESHPPFGEIEVTLDIGDHPVSAGLPTSWSLRDEFYHLRKVKLEDAAVLMTGISPAGGARRPVTWAKSYGEGRVVATILGHGPETHADPRYRRLVAQALRWVAAPR